MKKQPTVSCSSSEAEYPTLALTTCELQWLTYLLQDLHVPFVQPAILYCDNQSTIQIVSNQVFHERTKHIDIDCHIVREKVNIGLLKLLLISSSMQLADILLKLYLHPYFKACVPSWEWWIYIPSLRGALNITNWLVCILL